MSLIFVSGGGVGNRNGCSQLQLTDALDELVDRDAQQEPTERSRLLVKLCYYYC